MISETQLHKAALFPRILFWAGWGIIGSLAVSIVLYFVSLRTSGQLVVYFCSPISTAIFLILAFSLLTYGHSLHRISTNNPPTLKLLQVNLTTSYIVVALVILCFSYHAKQLITYSSLPYYTIFLFVIKVVVITSILVINVYALKWASTTVRTTMNQG